MALFYLTCLSTSFDMKIRRPNLRDGILLVRFGCNLPVTSQKTKSSIATANNVESSSRSRSNLQARGRRDNIALMRAG